MNYQILKRIILFWLALEIIFVIIYSPFNETAINYFGLNFCILMSFPLICFIILEIFPKKKQNAKEDLCEPKENKKWRWKIKQMDLCNHYLLL